MFKSMNNPIITGKRFGFVVVMILFITASLLADSIITRGPDVGEIYFIGPTVTQPVAIYHSTDFGETTTCMDSTLNTNINFMSIAADLTPGVLYGETVSEALYISYDYGQEGSWQFRDTAHWDIHSGRNEGEVYDSLVKHSIDYGINFISHSMNGFFGSRLTTEIDNQDKFGYAVVNQWGISDTLWLLISYDNFETLEIQNIYNINDFDISDLSRGTENGELYSFSGNSKTLYHSTDYGLIWEYINEFNTRPEYYHISYGDMVGGRQAGEIYVHAVYNANMMTIKHTYIFHSTDYGRTFTVYHPLSIGEEQLVANFSTSVREGETPFTVQFSNYSIGDIESYEWDFDNDGVIDSTEPQPEYTYQDTGYYSVKLSIHNANDSNEFLREDFIHVTNGSDANNDELQITNYELDNYPNPFNPSTTISYELPKNAKDAKIEIYNLKGQEIRTFPINRLTDSTIQQIIWNGKDNNDKPVSSGVYFYKLNLKDSPIKKMILIK